MTNSGAAADKTLAYNCPNCGAELMFDAGKQKLCCEFCESQFTIEEIDKTDSMQTAQAQAKNSDDYCEKMLEYSCPNCGAEVITDEETAADICIYCHSPIVLNGKLSGQMMPDKIIPFKFTKEEAQKKFSEFAKKKWFAPKAFKSLEQAEKISGIYYPFWVTDADTDSSYNAKATRVRVWRMGNVQYTETSKFNVERAGFIHFEDIVTSALSTGEKQVLEGILPYPSDSLVPFSMPYLSGFKAKKRDIERNALSEEVKKRMNDYATTLLKNTVGGYSTVKTTSCVVRINKCHWEYSLMPIWMLNYVTPRKTYKYAMNGYTGKLYGEVPVSIGKALAFCGAIFAVAAPLLGWLGGLFL